MHRYSDNQIKHLQARISLLTEENNLLKKVLMHGSKDRRPNTEFNKENEERRANVSEDEDRKPTLQPLGELLDCIAEP